MNSTQRQDILNGIERFKKQDFTSAFIKKYGETTTDTSVVGVDYSVAELLAFAQRSMTQLEERLNADFWQVLPDYVIYYETNRMGLSQIVSDIITFLNGAMYKAAEKPIKALIYYQITHNFWDDSTNKKVGMRESTFTKWEKQYNILDSHIKARGKRVDETIKLLENKKQEIDRLINELQAQKDNKNESDRLLEQINNAAKDIDNKRSACETIETNLNTQLDEVKKKQNEVNDQSEKANQNLERIRTDIDKQQEKINNIYETVKGHSEEVKNMMGHIADGALGRSFNERTKTLRFHKWVWLVLTILIMIGAIWWVCNVFTNLRADTGNEWANLAINAIKSSPVFILLGFAMSQYQKERNLLEEYAYRETIAVTLNTYADEVEDAKNENKREVLRSTIEKLYTKPVINSREYDALKSGSMTISDLIKSLENLAGKLRGVDK